MAEREKGGTRPHHRSVNMPANTYDYVRKHLEQNAEALGRPPNINLFFAEAARRQVLEDMEYLRATEGQEPSLTGDEAAANWSEDVPVKPARSKR